MVNGRAGWTNRMLVACAIVVAMGGASGCKKLLGKLTKDAGGDTSVSGDGTGEDGEPTASGSELDDDDDDSKMLKKIDSYIDCLNSLSSQAHSARSRYLQWVKADVGPTGKERVVYGIYEIPKNEAEECRAAVTKANQLPPNDEKLEKAAENFATAIVELDEIVDEAHEYYDHKNYRDDKWAKGKEMHPKLMTAFKKFGSANAELHQTLDAITKPLAKRTLARIERIEGKKFRYHRKAVLNSARDLVEAGDPVGDDDDVDAELVQSAFGEFDKALEGLKTYGDANANDLEGRNNPSWPLAKSNYTSFVSAAASYSKKAKEYVRCLRDAKPPARGANGKVDPDRISCPDGRPRDVIKEYNNFITSSNRAQFP